MQFRRGDFVLDCSIRDSGFIGLTGPNGSGKSTFLHLLAGVEFPDSGHVIAGDVEVTNLPTSERKIIYLNPETYFGHVEVDRHLKWGEKAEDRSPGLESVKEGLGITYSGRLSRLSLGQRARVILGTAIMASPRLILIDELFANISGRGEVIAYMKRVSKSLSTDVIFVTQDQADLSKADAVYLMDSGHLAKRG